MSLAWPWPGRSLPKGNQWEWWDPQQGPLPGLGEVGHSPREPVGVLGPWTGAQCGWAPSPSATSNAPPTPPMAANAPDTPMLPWVTYTLLAWVATLPAAPNSPWHPLHPLGVPSTLWCHLKPCRPMSAYNPCQLPIAPWHPNTPDGPQSPWWLPTPLTPLHPLGASDATYTPAGPWVPTLPASPNAPLTPYTLWQPQMPPTPPTSPSLLLSSVFNRPFLVFKSMSSVFNRPSLVFKSTSAVVLSSAYLCNISKIFTAKLQLLHNTVEQIHFMGKA